MKKCILFLGTGILLATASYAQAAQVKKVEINGATYEVADMTASDRITWGGYEEIGVAARNNNDGAANTAAIVKKVGDNKDHDGKNYAAKACTGLTINDQKDWYLPSLTEMQGIYSQNKIVQLPESNTYWTSTEASGTQAQTIYMYSGATYQVAKVDLSHFVCIRKVK